MLHLQAGVHLQEIEAPVVVEEKFQRAGAPVADGARAATASRPIRSRSSAMTAGDGASSMSFWWRRCTRAVALAQVDRVAVAIAEHLDLDVAGMLDEPLEDQRGVAEGAAGLAPRAASASANSAGARTSRMPRPPPPATALTSSGKPSRAPRGSVASSCSSPR